MLHEIHAKLEEVKQYQREQNSHAWKNSKIEKRKRSLKIFRLLFL
ncbi:hypothetical protein [Bacillus coahuilensis]|nr:hypothetical protein [Bacillus coahuilensis]